MKVKARVKFEAVGVEGSTYNELKILYFNGLLTRDKYEALRAERKKLDALKNEEKNEKDYKKADTIAEENSSDDEAIVNSRIDTHRSSLPSSAQNTGCQPFDAINLQQEDSLYENST